MYKRAIIFSIILIFFAFSAEAKDLYVDGSIGNDSVSYENNSALNPWRTIGRAAWGSTNRIAPNASQAARAGDTVNITAGTYLTTGSGSRWQVAYNPINSGSSGNRITFQAVGTVTLQYSSGAGPMIGASNIENPGGNHARSYITWKGFTIYEANATTLTDAGVVMLAGGSHNTIENCFIDGNVNSPLGGNNAGIYLAWTSDVTIRNNKIQNVRDFGGFGHNAGGVLSYYANDVLIENNEIEACGAGVTLKGGNNERWTIRYNLIHSGGKGVAVVGHWDYSTGFGKIYQNVIYNSGAGIVFGGSSDPYKRFYVVNNTLYDCGTGSEEVGIGTWITYVALEDIFIYNNIISGSYELINMGYCASGHCLVPTVLLDRNNYYKATGFRNSIERRAYTSIANWRTALGSCPNTGNDCNSITTDPRFVNAGESNFRLQDASAARSLGRTIMEIHGSSGQTIPAGAYITGEEVIGIRGGEQPEAPLSPPSMLRILD